MTADEGTQHKVQVYVYDISNGLAKLYSQAFLGTHLDAIYHTSVVVYGKEYYYDQEGIVAGIPQRTRFGQPLEILNKGSTFVPQDILDEFIEDLKTEQFKLGSYKLFENNCNHFTHTILGFLNDGLLDDHILNLPQIVKDSPNGAMIQQMFSNSGL
ncbi:hypothetical protein WICMUC_001774 [Wickerhamomyces mucosus]|uniref:PPPDE domain-containing protein n=1 Tax=Wickerhamomyces mucosus TaxID=1378264 RepID=A0A9P8TF18_9ASCO|nr:hypothetical protein WICMUC_001774 [Wickerhamomyces mucosus]